MNLVEDPVLTQINADDLQDLIENESIVQSALENNLSSMDQQKQYFASRGINNITELSYSNANKGVSPMPGAVRKGETPGLKLQALNLQSHNCGYSIRNLQIFHRLLFLTIPYASGTPCLLMIPMHS